jgi:choline dehydrogenase-like flavoprotein
LKPSSRGRVTLRSPVPHAKPRIRHDYLATGEDRATLAEGVRIALDVASRPALRSVTRDGFALPASASDADVATFLERHAQTLFHPVGSCGMGRVVDAALRVYGVDGLRVVDASAMPTIPRGNTNAATIMLAEKASDLIRGLRPLAAAGGEQRESVPV